MKSEMTEDFHLFGVNMVTELDNFNHEINLTLTSQNSGYKVVRKSEQGSVERKNGAQKANEAHLLLNKKSYTGKALPLHIQVQDKP